MLGDLRYAFRLTARNPGFTTLAILMLALGIGANTAIFSVVDAALFKPLPYRDPDRLVDILRVARPGTAEEVSYIGMTRESLADWRAQRQIFEGIESYAQRLAVFTAADRTESIPVCHISPGLVDFLGFKPKLGRGFTSEDAIIGNDRLILLGEGLWRRMFGADPTAIGRTVTLDDLPCTVVGVLPLQFRFPPDYAAEPIKNRHEFHEFHELRSVQLSGVTRPR